MTSFNTSSAALGSDPITPPPGVKLDTPEKEQVYRAALEFERFFVQQLLKPMEEAGSLLGDDEGESATGSAGMSGYKDMAQDQLTQAVLDGGGLGLAATMYGQLANQIGLDTGTATKPATGGAA